MKLGFGMPALNNDEIIIPSFIQWGVKEEDAYNYSANWLRGDRRSRKMGLPLYRHVLH